MLPTLQIQLLGDFRLVYGDQPVRTIDSPRLQSLLAYLLLQRDAPQPRQRVAFLLYLDSSEVQARTNLRNLLHLLRESLPDANVFLNADAQTMQWLSHAPFTLDVDQFEQAARQANSTDSLRQAVELYHGDLLPGCYDDWILPERERLQQKFVETLERLILLLEKQQDYRAAMRYAEQLLRLDPLREETYRQLMRLHALNGDRAGALHLYHTCATTLQRELQVEPSAETRQVYDHLLSPTAQPLPKSAPPLSLVAISNLVNRHQEWAQLQTLWSKTAEGQSHFVLLTGEAGIGKSRLAEEMLDWARRQDIALARAYCYAAEGALAYAPVTAWLRERSLTSLDDVWLTEVARLLPELQVTRPDLHPEPLTQHWQRQRFFEALARAILYGSQPLLLFIDDLHWCDRDTLEWLHYLLRFDVRAPLLILGTRRPEEMVADHPLAGLLVALQHAGQVTDIELSPLNKAETISLAANVAGQSISPALAEHLYRETEGNALFVVEAVRAELITRAREGGSKEAFLPGPDFSSIPPKVQTLIAARLGQLSPSARELIHVAATIGREFTFEVLARASGENEDVLIRALDEVWQRRLVRERSADAYDFSHDKIREVAYQSLLAPRRRSLHRKVAEAMQVVYADRLGEFCGIIAQHYVRAEVWDKAAEYLVRAGEGATDLGDLREARAYYIEGLTALSHLPDTADNRRRRVDTILRLVAVSSTADDPERNLARLAEAETVARTLPATNGEALEREDRLRRARIHYWIARIQIYRNEVGEAIRYFQQLLETEQAPSDDVELSALPRSILGQTMIQQGQFGKAVPLFREAIPALEKAGNWAEWMRAVGFLGLSLSGQGNYTRGLTEIHRARTKALQAKNPTILAWSNLILAFSHILGGEVSASLEASHALEKIAEQAGEWVYVYIGHAFRAWAESRLGNHQAAEASMTRAKATARRTGGRLLFADLFAAAEAEIAFNAGRSEEALRLAAEAVATSQAGGSLLSIGIAQRVWGQTLASLSEVEGSPPRWDEAEQHLAASVQAFEAGDMQLEAARMHVAWGLVCRDRGDRAAAREHFEKAAVQFRASERTKELEQTGALIATLA